MKEEQSMKIKPLNDWAVIVPSEAMTRTAGGLFIPDAAKEKPAEGTVEAIGPGALEEEKRREKKKEKKERKFIATSVKPGERVMYDRYAGQKITIGGVERVLVREASILGILPPAPAKPIEDLPPLLLPSMTATGASTALVSRKTTAVPVKKQAPRPAVKKTVKKATIKSVKRAAKKTVKKAAKKKTAKKVAGKPKKAASKKTASKKAKKKR
jgi:chaperonin GroES